MSARNSSSSMKNFDLSELDFNNLGSWPLPVRVVSCVLLLVAVLAAGYFFYVTDLQEELQQHKNTEVALKEEFERKYKDAANLEAYREQMVLMEASFERLLKQLPSDTEVPGLLEDITSAGLNSGLEFDEIKLRPEVSQQFYIELPIQVRVRGGYHELATFVSAVASLPRIVTLHDFDIQPEKGATNRLAMNILVKTYRYKAQEADK